MTTNDNTTARQAGLIELIDAYGRACRRDGNPAWESEEGKALKVFLAAHSADARTDPAPAAQADHESESIAYQAGYEAGMRRATRQQSDAKLDTAFSGAVNAAVALERKQSAAPAEPVQDDEASEVEKAVVVLESLLTWRAEDWSEFFERCPDIVALIRPILVDATPADAASEADKREAERYQLIKRSGLILSGGYTKFGWLISPFGDQCDKYLDAVLQRERQQGADHG